MSLMNTSIATTSARRALLGVVLVLTACGGGAPSDPASPVITAQPADVSVLAGSSAAFRVTATGDSLTYQWQGSVDDGSTWSGISGATAASYSLSNVQLGDSGHLFRVLVTGGASTVTSASARLTVTATPLAPTITVQPASQTVTQPATATFTVVATGTELHYQWQLSLTGGESWDDIGDATAATYTTPATSAEANGTEFRVQVSNTIASVTSDAATLTIHAAPPTNEAPSFTVQPANQSVSIGSSATFTASVAGTPTPTLQWQRTDDGTTWNDIADATSDTYITASTIADDDGAQFRLVATSSEGTATSDTVVLTVTADIAPSFTTQPHSAQVAAGVAVTFTAVAEGTPTPTYLWQLSSDLGQTWVDLSNDTNPSYEAGPANRFSADSQFRVVASNTAGSAISDVVKVELVCPIAMTFASPDGGGHHLLFLHDNHGDFCPSVSSDTYDADTSIHTIEFKDVTTITNGWTLTIVYRGASEANPALLTVTYLHPYQDTSFGFIPFSCGGVLDCSDISVDLDNHLITFDATALQGPSTGDGDQGIVSWFGTLSY
jgi:hypothetical protein